ncbi:MAG: gliding motility-associated C-terminal domain-containing protein [Saprospiraceae bacterium]|nr:gliding motility-associated C-terminal domain-containing protein [Saprospiraceae bacterium]
MIKYFKFAVVAIVSLLTHAATAQCDPNLPQPTITCPEAPIVCELNNFCSTFPNVNFNINVSGCAGFQALNNPHYFSFIATSTTISITIEYTNCTQSGGSRGPQAAILSACPGGGGGPLAVVPGACDTECGNTNGNISLSSNQFVIGQQYWFLLDGCAGSICDYRIVNTIGIEAPSLEDQVPTSIDVSGPTVVCPGEEVTITVAQPEFANQFIWTMPFGAQQTTNLNNVTFQVPNGTAAGQYEVCLFNALNPCDNLQNYNYLGDACFTFTVEELPPTNLGPFDICLGETYVSPDGTEITPASGGQFSTSYELISDRGCDSTIIVTLNVIDNLPINEEIIICAGETYNDPIIGIVSDPGDYPMVITNANGCPQDYNLILKTITVTEDLMFLTTDDIICPEDPAIMDANGSNALLLPDNSFLPGLQGSWLLNGTEISGGFDLSTIEPGIYTFIAYIDYNGVVCADTAVFAISYSVVIPDEPVISGPANGCLGNQAVFVLENYDSELLTTWTINGSLLPDGPSNGQVFVVNLNNQGVHEICVEVLNLSCPSLTNQHCFTIQVDEELPVEINGQDRFCEGSNTILTAQSGATGASYQWSGGGGNNTSASYNSTGTYAVTVTDNRGCTGSTSVTVTMVNNPEPMITGSASYCIGSNTTLAALGGPFTSYLWTGGATTPNVTINAPGTVVLTVTNSDGCSGTASVTVSEQTELSPAIGGPSGFCSGQMVTLDAGAFFATYLWSNNATTSSIQTNTGGVYSVTVTDASGCSGTSSVTVVENNNPVPMITTPALQVCPEDDALLTVNLANVSYMWNNSTTGQTLTAVNAGTYSVTVTDGNGCTGTTSVTTTEFTSPAPVITGQDYYCAGGDVSIGVSATFAGYEWSGGVPQNAQNTTVNTAGTYVVTVTDGNGCSANTSFMVRQEANPVPVVQGGGDVCEGFSATLSTTQAFTAYSWSTGAITPTIDVNTTGTYIVTVTNTLGCEGTAQANVVIRPTPTVVIGGSSTFCIGFSATLDAGSFTTYLWSTGATSPELIVNVAGQYCVTVTDQYGCVASACKDIIQDTELNTTITGDAFYCAGDSTRVDVGGGFAMYTWSGGLPSTRQVWISTPGMYPVTVSDVSGCTGSASVTVAENALPQPLITGPGSFCTGNTAILDGGTWASYEWSTTAISRTITVSTGGTYALTVVDGNGCVGTTSRAIEELAELSPGISGDRDFCAGLSTTLTIEPGYTTYQWLDNSSMNPDRVFTTGGTFTVRVTDADGCSGTGTVTVEVLPLPIADAGEDKELTCRDSVQTLGGNNTPQSGHRYEWKEISGTVVSGTGRLLEVTTAGMYELLVVNSQTGCMKTDTARVTLNANLITDAEITSKDPTCFNDRDGAIVIETVIGGTSPYTYTINNQTGQQLQGLSPGSYDVEIEDANGCRYTAQIILNNPEQLTLDVGPDLTLSYGDTLVVVPVTNMSPPYTNLEWLEGDTICTGCINLVLDIIPELSNIYRLTLADANGCEVSDFLRVTLKRNRNVFIPTGFSPDFNGRNDRLTVYGGKDLIRVKSFKVFDRWGEMVFIEEDFPPADLEENIPHGWDGTFQGRELVPAVYAYLAEVIFNDGQIIKVYGNVALIR